MTESLGVFGRVLVWLKGNLLWLLPVLVILTLGVNEVYRQLLILFALAGLYLIIRRPAEVFFDTSLRWFGLLLACFLLPMLISLIDSETLGRSTEAFTRFVSYFLVAVVFLRFAWRPGFERYLIYGVFAVMLFWCVDGLIQFFVGSDLFGKELFQNSRLTGPFEGPKLGFVLAILSPIYFEAVRLIVQRYRFAWILIIPLLAVVILGGSRTSWMLLVVGMVGYFIFILRLTRGRFPWRKLLLPLLLLFVVSGVVVDKVDWLKPRIMIVADLFSGDYQRMNEATSIRLPLWDAAVQISREHWVNGVGLRGYGTVYYEMAGEEVHPMFKGVNGHPHLFILETSAELGLIGLVGYAVFIFLLVRASIGRAIPCVTPWALAALLAAFPLSSTLSMYASFMSSIIWVLVIVWVVLEKQVGVKGSA